MPRRLAEQTNTARTHLTLNEVVICYASYRFALIIFKRFRLLPSKVHACTISYAESFARLARVLEAVIRKCEIRK